MSIPFLGEQQSGVMTHEPEPTETEPQRDDLAHLVQRERAQTTGDVIAAQVGEGAEHIAVGKNIIQIGSLQIPRWLAFAILSVLGLSMVIGGITYFKVNRNTQTSEALLAQAKATPTPTVTPTPVQMTGDFNIVVGKFGQVDAQGNITETKLGTELSLWLARRIDETLKGVDAQSAFGHITIWHNNWHNDATALGNPTIGIIRTPQDINYLVSTINASMIISGVLTGPVNNPTLQLGFYYARPRVSEQPDAALGQHLFGRPIEIQYADDPQSAIEKLNDPNNPEVRQRVEALVWLLKGLTKDSVGEPVQALDLFKKGESQLQAWQNPWAKAVFYYFMGRTALLLNDLDEAQRTFTLAATNDPQNIPAQIGLGNYEYTLAQNYFVSQQPLTTTVAICANAFASNKIDVNAKAVQASKMITGFNGVMETLNRAQTQYQHALDLAAQANTSTSYAADIATIMLAAAHRLAGEATIYQFDELRLKGAAPLALLDQASEQLAQANTLYLQMREPLGQAQSIGLLAYTNYGLGLTQRAQGYVNEQRKAAKQAKLDYAHALNSFQACTKLKDRPDWNEVSCDLQGKCDLQKKSSCFCAAYKTQVEQEYLKLGGGE